MTPGEDRATAAVDRLVRAAAAGRYDVRWSTADADPLVTVRARRTTGHTLALRVQDGGVLLSVDEAQAIEFVMDDGEDAGSLEHVVRAFCTGELRVQVGSKDNRLYGLRCGGTELWVPTGVLARWRSGRRYWRQVG